LSIFLYLSHICIYLVCVWARFIIDSVQIIKFIFLSIFLYLFRICMYVVCEWDSWLVLFKFYLYINYWLYIFKFYLYINYKICIFVYLFIFVSHLHVCCVWVRFMIGSIQILFVHKLLIIYIYIYIHTHTHAHKILV